MEKQFSLPNYNLISNYISQRAAQLNTPDVRFTRFDTPSISNRYVINDEKSNETRLTDMMHELTDTNNDKISMISDNNVSNVNNVSNNVNNVSNNVNNNKINQNIIDKYNCIEKNYKDIETVEKFMSRNTIEAFTISNRELNNKKKEILKEIDDLENILSNQYITDNPEYIQIKNSIDKIRSKINYNNNTTQLNRYMSIIVIIIICLVVFVIINTFILYRINLKSSIRNHNKQSLY